MSYYINESLLTDYVTFSPNIYNSYICQENISSMHKISVLLSPNMLAYVL
jgi:hypothetical protein